MRINDYNNNNKNNNDDDDKDNNKTSRKHTQIPTCAQAPTRTQQTQKERNIFIYIYIEREIYTYISIEKYICICTYREILLCILCPLKLARKAGEVAYRIVENPYTCDTYIYTYIYIVRRNAC